MSLNDLWEGAADNPYYPAVAKERQFLVASVLLLTGIRKIRVSCTKTDG